MKECSFQKYQQAVKLSLKIIDFQIFTSRESKVGNFSDKAHSPRNGLYSQEHAAEL